jgi:hypothetical protein
VKREIVTIERETGAIYAEVPIDENFTMPHENGGDIQQTRGNKTAQKRVGETIRG